MPKKFDKSGAQDVFDWIAAVSKSEPLTIGTEDDVKNALSDGNTLCSLANAIKPKSIKKFNKGAKMPFQKMENIGFFNGFCKKLGVTEEYIFVTSDLFEGKNINQVIICLRDVATKTAETTGVQLGNTKLAAGASINVDQLDGSAGNPIWSHARNTNVKSADMDYELGQQCVDWIAKALALPNIAVNCAADLQNVLLDGVTLCQLAEKLAPGSSKKMNRDPKMPFAKMENIGLFNDFCKGFGCTEEYLFVTTDLYEGSNMQQVITCLRDVAKRAQEKGLLEFNM